MQELLTVQDGGEGQNAGLIEANGIGGDAEAAPLVEEEVESIRQRTAAFLLGEGRQVNFVVSFRRCFGWRGLVCRCSFSHVYYFDVTKMI